MVGSSTEIGIIGQLPGISTYCVIVLGFALPDEAKRQIVISTLQHASLKLSEIYPWLSGQIVHDKPSKEEALRSSGSFRIAPYDAHDGKPWVQVKDCTKILPSYEEYIAAKAPTSMLDGSILSPYRGIPESHDFSKPAPVILLQVNLVKGGVLLTFNGMHHAMDMTGLGALIRQFAALCRGESPSAEEIKAGNMDQKTAVPILPADEKPDPLPNFRRESKLANPGWAGMPVAAPWIYFRFPASTALRLKQEAQAELSPPDTIEYITTNDAISAFFWQRLTLIRSKRHQEQDSSASSSPKTTQLLRPIHGRRSLNPPLPLTYLGHMVTVIGTALPLSQMQNASLSSLAIQLRTTIIKEATEHHFRSMATLLHHEPDKTTFGYEANMNPELDIMPSSWADLGLYTQSFGPDLGVPGFVRRPILAEVLGLTYLMPRTREGDWDLCTSLTEEDVKGLEGDRVFSTLVEKIG